VEGVNKFPANVLEMSQNKGPAYLPGEKCIQNSLVPLSPQVLDNGKHPSALSWGRPYSQGGSL